MVGESRRCTTILSAAASPQVPEAHRFGILVVVEQFLNGRDVRVTSQVHDSRIRVAVDGDGFLFHVIAISRIIEKFLDQVELVKSHDDVRSCIVVIVETWIGPLMKESIIAPFLENLALSRAVENEPAASLNKTLEPGLGKGARRI